MFKIVTTIGPSSDSISTLIDLKNNGATSFRINLSHMNEVSLDKYFSFFESAEVIPSLDTQGAQMRTSHISDGSSSVQDGDSIQFSTYTSALSQDCLFSLNQLDALSQLDIGDILKIDFDGVSLQITEKNIQENLFRAKVLSGGKIKPNKAVDIDNKSLALSPLTEFDLHALSMAKKNNVSEIFMSFCNTAADILSLKSYLSQTYGEKLPRIIAKIETKSAVNNIADICRVADALLIDRGDLSRELSISSIPKVVNKIIEYSNSVKIPVLVATNVLDSMMLAPMPSRAEVSDIYNLIERGVDGLVLAAEVAIGNNPVDSVRIINYLQKYYHAESFGLPSSEFKNDLPPRFRYWL